MHFLAFIFVLMGEIEIAVIFLALHAMFNQKK